MEIKRVTQICAFVVETNGSEWNDYTRYGHDSWTVRMGESEEPVYDCAELELMFQKYMESFDPPESDRS